MHDTPALMAARLAEFLLILKLYDARNYLQVCHSLHFYGYKNGESFHGPK